MLFLLPIAHVERLSHSLEKSPVLKKAFETDSEQALTRGAHDSGSESIVHPEITMNYSAHRGPLFSFFWCSCYLSPDFLKGTESLLPHPVFSVYPQCHPQLTLRALSCFFF